MRKSVIIAGLAAALSLSACGKQSGEVGPGKGGPGGGDGAGKKAFAQCASCHSTKPGENGAGPSLAGVVGRKAGTLAGFSFSDANKASGIIWDEKALDTYLTNPAKMVPGTRMSYVGIADPDKRKALIEYLKTLK